MRLAAWALIFLLALAQDARAERVVTDSAGRQVALPDRIERVFAAGPPAMVLLYVLAPDRIVGWPARRIPRRWPISAAIILGAGYLLLVDTLARIIAAVETPIGILTAFVGAPVFLWLLARGRHGWA
jgi:iron complex transport system permease protein